MLQLERTEVELERQANPAKSIGSRVSVLTVRGLAGVALAMLTFGELAMPTLPVTATVPTVFTGTGLVAGLTTVTVWGLPA